MKYEIIERELVNTGGNCMVLFSTIWLHDERKAVYSANNDEISEIYATQDEAAECQPENAISTYWFFEADNITDGFEPIHKQLLELYNELVH